MKNTATLITIAFITSIFFSNNTQAQSDGAVKEIMKAYEKAMESYDVYSKCGDEYDGALTFGKSIEQGLLNAFTSISLKDELELGRRMHDTVKKHYSVLPNPMVENAFSQMLLDSILSPFLTRKGISYRVYLVHDQETINAFTHGGGYIYITTGLLQFVKSMDELAFIIAHEISHVDLSHTLDQYKRLMAISKISASGSQSLAQVAHNFTFLYATPFDQMKEYEADMNAVKIAIAAGFDPTKFADFFKRVAKFEKRGNSLDDKFTRSHPYSEDRISCLEHHVQMILNE